MGTQSWPAARIVFGDTQITVLAAGHDCVPIVFNLDQTGQLSVGGKLEEDKKVDTGEQGNTRMAMQMFQNKDRVGRSDISDTVLDTTHQNQVYEMRIYAGGQDCGLYGVNCGWRW
jgi:actin related protein 2/3 complex subunit 1A/1B